MASVFSTIWPGILGLAGTAVVIYLSVRGMERSRNHVTVLEWRAELSESTGQEKGAANRLEG